MVLRRIQERSFGPRGDGEEGVERRTPSTSPLQPACLLKPRGPRTGPRMYVYPMSISTGSHHTYQPYHNTGKTEKATTRFKIHISRDQGQDQGTKQVLHGEPQNGEGTRGREAHREKEDDNKKQATGTSRRLAKDKHQDGPPCS